MLSVDESRIVIELTMCLCMLSLGRCFAATPLQEFIKTGFIFTLLASFIIISANVGMTRNEARLVEIENIIHEAGK